MQFLCPIHSQIGSITSYCTFKANFLTPQIKDTIVLLFVGLCFLKFRRSSNYGNFWRFFIKLELVVGRQLTRLFSATTLDFLLIEIILVAFSCYLENRGKTFFFHTQNLGHIFIEYHLLGKAQNWNTLNQSHFSFNSLSSKVFVNVTCKISSNILGLKYFAHFW